MSDAEKKCSGADCDKNAGTLQCPTCLKQGVEGSYFCAQDCFKRNWVGYTRANISYNGDSNLDSIQTTHKAMHKAGNGIVQVAWGSPL